MAVQRYCSSCGTDVTPREKPRGSALALICPRCDRRIATTYGHIVIQ